MYHSITIGDKNTWDDWHLIPTSRPIFSPPEAKTTYVELAGIDGQVDLSESLTGYPLFGTRSGSFEFYVVDGEDYGTWSKRYSEIMEYLHNRRLKAFLEDEPEYYYEGRFNVSQWQSGQYWSGVTIAYVVDPYKKELVSSMDEWIWDTFSFETGVIRSMKDLIVSGSLTVTIEGTQQPVTPSFTASSEMSVTFNGSTYSLIAGTSKLAKVIIKSGTNTLTFTGNGVVSVDYRGGKL